jgi:hypothetical protein
MVTSLQVSSTREKVKPCHRIKQDLTPLAHEGVTDTNNVDLVQGRLPRRPLDFDY